MNTNKIYDEVVARITKELESGNIPWLKPWTGANGAWSRATGRNYSLLNQFLMPKGEYATFKQIQEEGGHVLKGSKSYPVIFWKIYTKEEEDENGEKVTRKYPVLKEYRVFNIETQTDLERKYNKDAGTSEIEPLPILEGMREAYTKKYGIEFYEMEGDRAYYSPMRDMVVVPLKEQFNDTAEYYSTVYHELGHSTGHSKRLNRGLDTQNAAFGSETYGREELVAELTACGILANLGVETNTSFRNNAAYIQSWLKAIKEDPKAIVWASSRAEKAYEMIMECKPEGEPDSPDGGETENAPEIEEIKAEETTETVPEASNGTEGDYIIRGKLWKGAFYKTFLKNSPKVAGLDYIKGEHADYLKVSGYTFDLSLVDKNKTWKSGLRIGLNKEGKFWYATMTKNGAIAGYGNGYKTREEAINALIDFYSMNDFNYWNLTQNRLAEGFLGDVQNEIARLG